MIVILTSVLDYYSGYIGLLEDGELRTQGQNLKNIFLGGKGMPENWETLNSTPVRIGLLNDLYRKPVVLSTMNNTNLNNVTLNFTVTFDPSCTNTTRENTIRIYNDTNHVHPFKLYNKTLCPSSQYIKSAEVAMNATVMAMRPTAFYVYFSPDPGVNGTSYGNLAFPYFPNGSNYTTIVYPSEKLKMVSPAKVAAMRNLTYSQMLQTLGGNTQFELEVDFV